MLKLVVQLNCLKIITLNITHFIILAKHDTETIKLLHYAEGIWTPLIKFKPDKELHKNFISNFSNIPVASQLGCAIMSLSLQYQKPEGLSK